MSVLKCKAVLFFALALVIAEYHNVASTTTPLTTRTTATPRTTRTSQRTTTRKHPFPSKTYYLDDSITCTPTYTDNTRDMNSKNEVDYIKAWGYNQHRGLNTDCHITIHGYANYGLKFKFIGGSSSNYIRDLRVQLDIYEGYNDDGYTLASYGYYDTFHSSYIKTTRNYINIVLRNAGGFAANNYDFTLYVTSYDYYDDLSGGAVAGLVIGIIAFIALVSVLAVCGRRRRRRRLLAAGYVRQVDPVVTTSTYNYPTGTAPYPNTYGSMAPSPYGAAPQQNYNGAPPPPNYGDAPPPPPTYGGAPPSNYENKPGSQPPPPPVYNN